MNCWSIYHLPRRLSLLPLSIAVNVDDWAALGLGLNPDQNAVPTRQSCGVVLTLCKPTGFPFLVAVCRNSKPKRGVTLRFQGKSRPEGRNLS